MQSSPVSCYVTPVRSLCLSQQFCKMPYTGCSKNIGSKNENNNTIQCRSERRHIIITKYRHIGVQITTSIILRSLKSAVVPLIILKKKRRNGGGVKRRSIALQTSGRQRARRNPIHIDLEARAGLQNGAHCLRRPFTPAVGFTLFIYTSINPIEATK